MKVLVIDYEMGNLGSVKRSFEECGAEVLISEDPREIKSATHVVLPGVGAFHDGMSNLRRKNWIPAIEEAIKDGVPVLGICLGMQLLASTGSEGGETTGLGLIPGRVERLASQSERIPHVGWNEVSQSRPSSLLKTIPNGTDFYFVHSYHFIPRDPAHILSKTPYCGEFVSAIESKNVFGVQFHPEKSSKPGFQLFRNFLNLTTC